MTPTPAIKLYAPPRQLHVHFHFAVRKIAVEVVAVEGVRNADVQRAATQLAAHAARVQLPAAHAVLEVVLVDELARGDILDAHLVYFDRRGMRADEQPARVGAVNGLHVVEDVSAHIARKHLLHKVVGGVHHVARVEPDEVGRPLVVRRGGEQRRITGELYDVAVALAAREERRLRDRRAQVVFAVEPPPAVAHRVHGVLAHEHLGAVSVIAVVAAGIVDEPLIGIVDVLVDDGVAVLVVDEFPVVVGILRADVTPRW